MRTHPIYLVVSYENWYESPFLKYSSFLHKILESPDLLSQPMEYDNIIVVAALILKLLKTVEIRVYQTPLGAVER